MGKEQEKRPKPDLKRNLAIVLWLTASTGAGAKVGLAAFHGLAERLEQKPAIEEESQIINLVPTTPPTPKIEITPPEPEATPVLRAEIIFKPPVIPKVEPEVKAEVFRSLSRQYPEAWQELPSRAEKVIAYDKRIKQIGLDFFAQITEPIELSNLSTYQDLRIFGKYGMRELGLSLTKENLLFVLGWYELKYAQPIEQNPNFRRAVKKLVPAMRVVNEIMRDKLSPEEFRGEKIPQIPEIIQGNILFGKDNRGHRFFPEIYVVEWLFLDFNPENYQPLLEYLSIAVPHELIHAWPQQLLVGRTSSWFPEKDYEIKRKDTLWDIAQEDGLTVEDIFKKNPKIENPDLIFPGESLKIPQKGELIWPQNRKFHLAHMSMCTLTAPVQEKLGFEPGIEPRIVYIYSRLKEQGVEDPYGLIVQAGATFNSGKLWETYERVREEDDLSLDELIATNNPDPDFDYYTPEEFEAFRAEYAPYFSSKRLYSR